jgi:hypothetical protein
MKYKVQSFAARFTLRRQDGKTTFVSSHQPPSTRFNKATGFARRPTAPELTHIAKDILSMPHWQQWLKGQSAIVVMTNVFDDAEIVEIAVH